MNSRSATLSFLLALILLVGSCAHYKSQTSGSRRKILSGRGAHAVGELEKKAHESGKNQLLYLLDLGMAYHTSGQYKKAIDTFLMAEKIAEYKDFTSISEEASTFLVTDNVKNYKGEDFEKILINVYLAIDFMMLGELESALVEARKVNHLLYRLINEGKRPYKLNPLAYYLSGILYEKNKEPNSAYIDYKSTRKASQQFYPVGQDLIHISKLLRFHRDHAKWKRSYPANTSVTPSNPTGRKDLINRSYGEIITIVEVGRAPEKFPHPSWNTLPKFKNSPYSYNGVKVFVDGQPKADTQTIFSVEKAAHQNLKHRIGKIVAKKAAGVAAKAAVGVGVGAATGNKDLGVLTTILLMAADQADLRSWLTLPAEFQIARFAMPAGKYNVEFRYKRGKSVTSTGRTIRGVTVKKGGHTLLHHRVFE